MRVVFLLPGLDRCPVGGYKVVYEYANRFAADGHDVTVVYAEKRMRPRKKSVWFRLTRFLYRAARFCAMKITGRERQVPVWFDLDGRVKKEYVLTADRSRAMRADGAKVIATALSTSFETAEICGGGNPPRRRSPARSGYYFVQGFKSWGTQGPEEVYESYRLPLRKITIAPWLRDEIRRAGGDAAVVENGLDFEYFKMSGPIEKRSPHEIAMLYHTAEYKGTEDAVEALRIVRESVPDLHVNIFGVYRRPPNLPDWFTYHRTPTREVHNLIYNTSAVFVAPSRLEGMGLTPAESMICGCAVACTDNPGFAVFAKDNETALVSRAGDVRGLAENILRLIRDDGLRIRIARAGHEYIQQFTWERAYEKFKAAVEE